MMKLAVILLFLFSGLSAFAGNGGATTVGDGGHLIDCGSRTELFDLYEYRLNTGRPAVVSLSADKRASVREMADEGLQRIQRRFSLTAEEYARVSRAVKMFLFDNQFREERYWMNTFIFSAKELVVTNRVFQHMTAGKCQLETVVVRPPLNSFFSPLCAHNLSEFEYCFLTNSTRYWQLSRPQRACLVLHEALRFLPAAKAPDSEAGLRLLAAELCTE